MNYGFAFLSQPPFYLLLIVGIAALIPRARFAADRIEARANNPHVGELTPNLAQRLCLFLPGICALYAVVALRSPWAGVVLVAAYLLTFTAMILFLRGPSRR